MSSPESGDNYDLVLYSINHDILVQQTMVDKIWFNTNYIFCLPSRRYTESPYIGSNVQEHVLRIESWDNLAQEWLILVRMPGTPQKATVAGHKSVSLSLKSGFNNWIDSLGYLNR